MNDEKFRELLADYIAGELDQRQAAAFRAELEADPERRKLANELQAVAAALEANLLSEEEAEQRTASLQLEAAGVIRAPSAGEPAARYGPPRRLPLRSALRYAAVIALAFGAGFIVRGWQSESPAMTSPPPPMAINERYVASFAQATQSYPRSSTFTRSLLVLARK